jgi:hypothetical protein
MGIKERTSGAFQKLKEEVIGRKNIRETGGSSSAYTG